LALFHLLSARSFALDSSHGDDDMTTDAPVRPRSATTKVINRRKRRQIVDRALFTADPGPPELAGARLDRIRAKAPLLLELATETVRQSKAASDAAQLARARRVGRDLGVVNRNDYGHGIRLKPIRARDGTVLREADVVVADAPDPDRPKVTIRRARRTDSLIALFRSGTIDQRQVDAGELLRAAMEASLPTMPGVTRSDVHVAPLLRATVGDRQLRACRTVRSAFLILGAKLPVVVWILLGGTIGGYATHAGMRHTSAAGHLRTGLDRLAHHFGLAPTPAA
jgi:hypothetical protein